MESGRLTKKLPLASCNVAYISETNYMAHSWLLVSLARNAIWALMHLNLHPLSAYQEREPTAPLHPTGMINGVPAPSRRHNQTFIMLAIVLLLKLIISSPSHA